MPVKMAAENQPIRSLDSYSLMHAATLYIALLENERGKFYLKRLFNRLIVWQPLHT